MKRTFKLIISLFLAVAMVVSFTIPAAALSTSDAVSFGKWLASIPYTPGTALETSVDWFKSKFSSDDDSSAYSTYVSDNNLVNVNSSGTVGYSIDGSWWYESLHQDEFEYVTGLATRLYVEFNHVDTNDSNWYQGNCYLDFTVPSTFVGTLSFPVINYICPSGGITFYDGSPVSLAYSTDGGTSYAPLFSQNIYGYTEPYLSQEIVLNPDYLYRLTFLTASKYNNGYITAESVGNPVLYGSFEQSADTGSETRTGSLCGDYFYEGDDGTMMQAENISFVDETNNTVYNPATDTTATASSWVYDYATRTYTITATDGSTYKICMGDDVATEAVTDSAGTTVTYNYYYASDDGSSDSSGGTLWDFLSSIVDAITGFGSSIITGLSNIVSSAISGISDVISSLTGGIFTKLSDFLFGNGTSQSCTDFYNSPSTYSGVSVWG